MRVQHTYYTRFCTKINYFFGDLFTFRCSNAKIKQTSVPYIQRIKQKGYGSAMAKKIFNYIPALLLALFAVTPLMTIIALCRGEYFRLSAGGMWGAIIAVISVGVTVATLILRVEYNTCGSVLVIIALPLSLLRLACLAAHGISAFVLAGLSSIAVLILYVRLVNDSYGKAASAVCSVLLLITALVLFAIDIAKGYITTETVESSLGSPNGEYVAEVVRVTHPVIGDSSAVRVGYHDAVSKNFLGGFYKSSKKLYSGTESEIYSVRVEWKDDRTLIINGEEFETGF